jgi:hypothetical protein
MVAGIFRPGLSIEEVIIRFRLMRRFEKERQASSDKHDLMAHRAISWLSRPCASRNDRDKRFSGTIPMPTSLETNMQGPARALMASIKRAVSAGMSFSENIRLDSQRVRQSTRITLRGSFAAQHPDEIQLLFNSNP